MALKGDVLIGDIDVLVYLFVGQGCVDVVAMQQSLHQQTTLLNLGLRYRKSNSGSEGDVG